VALMGQTKGSARRIAFLVPGSSTSHLHLQAEFTRVLQELGWVEGRNLVLDQRYAEGDPARAASMTKELLALKPDVFVSGVDVYARTAAEAADKSLPIVFILGFDPVGLGLVKSLAAPGGNVTGFSVLNWELNPKRLSLLKEAVPRLDKVGMLYRDGDANAQAALRVTEQAGRDLRISVIPAPIQGADDIPPAFQRLAVSGAKGVMNVPDSLFFKLRQQIADLAIQHRMAAMFGATEAADAGMLMAYATDFKAMYARAALLVDRILKGANPANIPVEQANIYELVVNLRTARTLGIDLPRTLMLQATRVIE
jgi:putative tryptophan/tyrosine transport system substrate-binding protein